MRKLATILLMTLFGVSAQAQINFETGTFSDALAKASAQGKMIFMDCYTDWCMPCKILDHFVFKSVEAGDYFNEKFINFKIDMEKGEGIDLQKKYNVASYPTLLLLNPDGTEHNRLTGATNNPKEFIARVEEAAKKENSPVYQKQLYESDKSRANQYFSFLLSRGEYKSVSDLMLETFKKRTPQENYSAESFSLYEKAIHDIFNPLYFEILSDGDNAVKLLGEERYTGFVNAKWSSTFTSLAGAIIAGKLNSESEQLKRLSEMVSKFPILNKSSVKFLYTAEKQMAAQNCAELCAIAYDFIEKGDIFDENTIPGAISILVFYNKDYTPAIEFFEKLASFTKDEANRTKFLKNVEAYKQIQKKQAEQAADAAK